MEAAFLFGHGCVACMYIYHGVKHRVGRSVLACGRWSQRCASAGYLKILIMVSTSTVRVVVKCRLNQTNHRHFPELVKFCKEFRSSLVAVGILEQRRHSFRCTSLPASCLPTGGEPASSATKALVASVYRLAGETFQ